MKPNRTFALGVAGALLMLVTVTAADTWVEVRSPHFRVFTNAGEGNARHVAWQYEQIRSGLERAWPFAKAQLDRPVFVVAAKDEVTMRQLSPEEFEKKNAIQYSAMSQPANDGYYFLLRNAGREPAVSEDENPYHSAYWTYGILALDSGVNWRLPMWFSRGLAEVLSNTIILKNEMEFGHPIPNNVNTIAEGRFPLARILALTRDSQEMKNGTDLHRVSAQCWGVVQYILYGNPGPQGSERANMLVNLLISGVPSDQAVAKVYGSVAELDKAYSQFIAQGRFFSVKYKLDSAQSESEYASRVLKPDEAAAVRGAWLASSHRPNEARAAIADIRKINAGSALAYEIEGRLLEDEGNAAEAVQAFTRAIELGSENFYPFFAVGRSLASGSERAPETLAQARKHLERAVALNATNGYIFSHLSNAIWLARQYEDAIAPARQAVALIPDKVVYRANLARLLSITKHPDEALKEAKVAESLARTDDERRSVQALLAELSRGGG